MMSYCLGRWGLSTWIQRVFETTLISQHINMLITLHIDIGGDFDSQHVLKSGAKKIQQIQPQRDI